MTTAFIQQSSNINWWIMPAESPNLNLIELLWHELKPHTKDELVNGIARFWQERIDTEKCSRYTGHLQSVLPIVFAVKEKLLTNSVQIPKHWSFRSHQL